MTAVGNLVIPFSALTAEQCGMVADRGDAAIAAFGRAKVGRVLRSRLEVAVRRLRQIAERGTYGESPADLQVDLQAIYIAIDFFQISGLLPDSVPAPMAADLAKALEGKLESGRASRVAEQFLSQFWFALVLAKGGVSPGVPRTYTGDAMPDYVVSVDTLDCAIEVKRPESARSAPDAMDHAAGQIRSFGRPGFIAIDLTDVVVPRDMSVRYMDQAGKAVATVRAAFVTQTNRLEARARNYRRSDKYERVMGVTSFARLHFWEKPDLSQPKGTYFLSMATFPAACLGLVVSQTMKLRRIIANGAGEVAGGSVRRL